MKKTLLLLALFCFILQKPQPPQHPVEAPQPAALVVEAGRYAWAWADARYYTCFAPPEKAAY